MAKKVAMIVSPTGRKSPVKDADEGIRFLDIFTNGYMDISVEDATKILNKENSFEFAGWTVVLEDSLPENEVKEYRLTKGANKEVTSDASTMANITGATINTIVTRLRTKPDGFTVKGWKVEPL